MGSEFAAGIVLGVAACVVLVEFLRQFSAHLLIAEATELCRRSWVT